MHNIVIRKANIISARHMRKGATDIMILYFLLTLAPFDITSRYIIEYVLTYYYTLFYNLYIVLIQIIIDICGIACNTRVYGAHNGVFDITNDV